jgi:hypothetical protein
MVVKLISRDIVKHIIYGVAEIHSIKFIVYSFCFMLFLASFLFRCYSKNECI